MLHPPNTLESHTTHYPYKVEFVTTVPSHLSDKAFVCKIKNEKAIGFVGGTFEKGTISATIKTFETIPSP